MADPGASVTIRGGTLVLGDRIVRGEIAIEHGVITEIGRVASVRPDGEELDADGLLVAPGLVDLQVNGGFGYDLASANALLWAVGAALVTHGVTTFLPTAISPTAAEEAALTATASVGPSDTAYRGADAAGVHLEGPFLSPHRAGTHAPGRLAPVDHERARPWRPPRVRMVTLAPELTGAIDLIRRLRARGVVVAMGHTDATAAEARAGVDAGITAATHLFNAMAPLHHREIGPVGVALSDPRVMVMLICDGVHVDPAVVGIVAAAVGPDRLVLVSDAMAALGCGDGTYELAGRTVTVADSVAVDDDGTLAGSVAPLPVALANLVAWTGWSPADALRTVTANPARLLDLDGVGTLRVGARGDLVLLAPDLEVVTTVVAGTPVRIVR